MFGRRKRDTWADTSTPVTPTRSSTTREPRTSSRRRTTGTSASGTPFVSALEGLLYVKAGYRTPEGGLAEKLMTPEEARRDAVLGNLSALDDKERYWRMPDEYLSDRETVIREYSDEAVIEKLKKRIREDAADVGANEAYVARRLAEIGIVGGKAHRRQDAEKAGAYLGMIPELFVLDEKGAPLETEDGQWVLYVPPVTPETT
ncbi:hypothetical protein IK146_01325 [Candidatus Saccharibacteria bacterium]|nr:hypothetical protein [Candidatus Saccharibacteria bacterium]